LLLVAGPVVAHLGQHGVEALVALGERSEDSRQLVVDHERPPYSTERLITSYGDGLPVVNHFVEMALCKSIRDVNPSLPQLMDARISPFVSGRRWFYTSAAAAPMRAAWSWPADELDDVDRSLPAGVGSARGAR
jgi:hypothetical protein